MLSLGSYCIGIVSKDAGASLVCKLSDRMQRAKLASMSTLGLLLSHQLVVSRMQADISTTHLWQAGKEGPYLETGPIAP